MIDERPTLQTVARAAGVSPMTVSNAYNRPDQLSAETREKVLRIARELGYSGPDPAGRSLRRRRTDTVGVLLTERLPYAFTDPGMVAFLHGLASGLSDAGQALLLLPTIDDADHAHVRNALVDAFVLASLLPDDPAVAEVLGRRLPVVSWGASPIPGVARIGVDNGRAAAKAAQHLLDLGHREFGVISVGRPLLGNGAEPGEPVVVRGRHRAMQQRVSGFVRAVRAAGFDADAVTVVEADSNTEDGGAQAARELLENRRPTAIFGVTDVLAIGALSAAAEADVAVPAKLSVVGFDDVVAASRTVPPLTTVSQSLFDQGKLAATIVLDELAGRRTKTPPIRCELVVRASTAPPQGRQAGSAG